ncbi:uncharacterized protein BP5553_08956 [Venustampulla echinocandica]|uniref:Uncharacterized protein n=1 Tax=Venustampulla echinocandica TaxID=2656787 RepID=A0A370TDG0_9HELO|nr:uncharacterized protein BP5553_08956 [Venustampulla echinocandica]RDL32500.1 hypothetical protein BP5553_08956 [Venustampulla echinocandica]
MASRLNSRENQEALAVFRRIKVPGQYDRAVCSYCGMNKAWNTTQFCQPHMVTCDQYQNHLQETGKQTPSFHARAKLDRETRNRTATVSIASLFNSPRKQNREQLFAKAVYTSTVAFSTFHSPEWTEFFRALDFQVPNPKKLANELLNRCYDQVKEEVQEVIDKSTYVGIVSDGSSNVSRARVENIMVIAKGQAYYWKTSEVGSVTASAQWSLRYIHNIVKELTKDRVEKWSSFATDTCDTQRSLWAYIHSTPGLEHVHSVPCDSHGLQLIIKDLLDPNKDSNKEVIPSALRDFFKLPAKVIAFFASSGKQLALFRDIQRSNTGKVKALIATVPTRWGTQVRQIKSILDNELALKSFAIHPDTTKTINPIIQDDLFWQRLNGLYTLLLPLHECQKMSESNHATVFKVYQRWIDINLHIQKCAQPGNNPWWEEVAQYTKRDVAG